MPVPNSGQLPFSLLREEGHKTSWLTPDYPTVGTLYEIGPDFVLQEDHNNQLGHNLDTGAFEFKQCYGWSSFKRPKLTEVWMQQFNRTSGVRLHWKTNIGDPFRAKFAIYRSQTESDVINRVSTALLTVVQYAPEWASYKWIDGVGGPNDLFVCLGETASWHSQIQWGDYGTDDDTPPDSGRIVDPTTITSETPVKMSYVDLGPAGAAGGSAPWYYSIIPLDGRQYHTLGDGLNPTSYDASNNPTDPSQYVKGTLFQYTPNESAESDAVVGKGLKLFTSSGTWSAQNVGGTEVELIAQYLYYYYMGGGMISWQIHQGNVVSAVHDGSVAWNNIPRTDLIGIQNLQTSTDYTVFVNSQADGAGQDYPAITFTTDSATGLDSNYPVPNSVTITAVFGNDPYTINVSVTATDQSQGSKIQLRTNDGQIKYIPFYALDANGQASTDFTDVLDDAGTITVQARIQSSDDSTWGGSVSDSINV